MKLASQSDVGVSFAMLDTALKGKLNRGQAREWLRSVGWALPDEELDAMLDATRVGQEVHAQMRAGHFSDLDLKNSDTRMGMWAPEDLVHLQEAATLDSYDAEEYTHRHMGEVNEVRNNLRRDFGDLPENRSVGELRDALHMLAGGRGQIITRDALYRWAQTFGGVHKDDIDEALEMIGCGAADSFKVNDLAHIMLANVVHPPSAMELHGASKESGFAREKKAKQLVKSDRVRIVKDNLNSGVVAVVIDPDVAGKIRVRMPDGTITSYSANELEKVV
jgi:hypothetical protein